MTASQTLHGLTVGLNSLVPLARDASLDQQFATVALAASATHYFSTAMRHRCYQLFIAVVARPRTDR